MAIQKSICKQEDIFRFTDTNTLIDKHKTYSVSLPSNFIEATVFRYNSNPRDLAGSIALNALAAENMAQILLSFLETETILGSKFNHFFSILISQYRRKSES